jgi:DNA polymerase/3'-5' exonuclease PolX
MSVHNGEVEIPRQDGRGRRLLLDEATALGESLLAWLRTLPGCTEGSAVGTLHRQHERFDAIGLLVSAESPRAVIDAFCSSPAVAVVVRADTGRATVLTWLIYTSPSPRDRILSRIPSSG